MKINENIKKSEAWNVVKNSQTFIKKNNNNKKDIRKAFDIGWDYAKNLYEPQK